MVIVRIAGWFGRLMAPSMAPPKIFSITTNGAFHQLYAFKGTSDGYLPAGPLVQASDGNLYGTTQYGGIANYINGLGTVFRIDTNGSNFASVSFTTTSGANPLGGLVEGPDGNLYGTTAYGGTTGHGTIFRANLQEPNILQPTTLYSFTDFGQGEYPNASLLAAKDGFMYGLVSGDGTNSTGTIFRFSTNGQFAVLFQMNNSNGNYVVHSASLTQGTNGLIYGDPLRRRHQFERHDLFTGRRGIAFLSAEHCLGDLLQWDLHVDLQLDARQHLPDSLFSEFAGHKLGGPWTAHSRYKQFHDRFFRHPDQLFAGLLQIHNKAVMSEGSPGNRVL
jgi:uncharacterized repeat protein (TIGR03803 family)